MSHICDAYDKMRFDDSKALGLLTIVRREGVGKKIIRLYSSAIRR